MTQQIDWLLFAVNRLGGATKAAKRIGVRRGEVAGWLLNGTAKARYGDIMRLMKLAKVPAAEPRLGPPRKSDVKYCERSAAA